jgi:sulfur relay (sulfurtransferase) DsrF/TusC family protein
VAAGDVVSVVVANFCTLHRILRLFGLESIYIARFSLSRVGITRFDARSNALRLSANFCKASSLSVERIP